MMTLESKESGVRDAIMRAVRQTIIALESGTLSASNAIPWLRARG